MFITLIEHKAQVDYNVCMQILRYMSDLFEGWKGFNVQEEREKGKDLNLITLICKKLNKGKSIKVIANEVEENVEMVKEIAIIAERYLPDYDEEKIYKEWKEKITV